MTAPPALPTSASDRRPGAGLPRAPDEGELAAWPLVAEGGEGVIKIMEAYQLERSGGEMMESVMAISWGSGALSTEPISSRAQSARTSRGERTFEAALMTVEEVADQHKDGKSSSETRPEAEVANKGIYALQPTGVEAKEQPETARLDTITCEFHANNTMLQCKTILDGGSSHTRMEPRAAEAVVKGAGGLVDVDMVVVLANGKRSCEQQRRLRGGVVFTLWDSVTSIMAAHHAPRVCENGGEAPGLLLGGPTITALALRPDLANGICTFRTHPTNRRSAAAQSNGVGAAGPRAPTCGESVGAFRGFGEVCTDGGTEFSGEFHEFLVEHDIDHPKPLPYHPQPNGLAQGMVKTVEEALMRYVVQPGKRVIWDTFLPSIERGYRCSTQANTRYIPYKLVYGRAPVFPAQARALFEESAVDFNSPEGMWELITVRAERLALMVPTAMHNVEAA
eukprot:jgi/Tetstr1/464746/TSEL_009493.t1